MPTYNFRNTETEEEFEVVIKIAELDDYKKNIVEWESKGGIGVHHTETAKTLSELKRLGFK